MNECSYFIRSAKGKFIWLVNGIFFVFVGVPISEGTVKKTSHHDRHHVGHQTFMKASLLGTLSSRHQLCPSLHGGNDPKTVFFSEHVYIEQGLIPHMFKGRTNERRT